MCPVTSEHIRSGLDVLNAVLTYGVDGLAEQMRTSALLAQLGLNPDVFFDELYISRPSIEAAILSKFEQSALHSICIAPIGWGKTTVVHAALRQYEKKHGLPTVVIDFKTDSVSLPSISEVDKHINKNVKRQLGPWIRSNLPVNGDTSGAYNLSVALHLLNHSFDSFVHAGALDASARLLTTRSIYEPTNTAPLGDWVLATSRDGDSRLAETVRDDLKALCELLRSRDFGESILSAKYGKAKRQRIAVVLDNVDQVPDRKTLESIVSWLTRADAYSPAFVFMVCVRPENHKVIASADDTGLFGEDSTHVLKWSLGDVALTDEQMSEWQAFMGETGVSHGDDEAEHLSDGPMSQHAIAFDDLVHNRRLHFAAGSVESGRIDGIRREDLAAVSSAAKEVLRDGNIRSDATAQANGNIRLMLTSISNFIEYVVQDLQLEWAEIGAPRPERPETIPASPERRKQALRTIYYRYIGSGPEAGQYPVFDAAVYDPVRSVLDCGWNGDVLTADSSESIVTACRHILVMLALFNECGNTREAPCEGAISVAKLVETCSHLGLAPEDTIEVLHDTVRHVHHRFAWMFDLDHFLSVREGEREIELDDMLASTPRCHRIMSSTTFMTGYLCERLRIHGLVPKDPGDRRLIARGLLSEKCIDAFLRWTARLGTIECWWVEALQKRSHVSAQGADWYRDLFSIRDSYSGRARPALCTQRVARSAHVYFDRSARDQLIRSRDKQLRKKYAFAATQLRSLDKKLDRVWTNIARGEVWGIPRDRAIPYSGRKVHGVTAT